MRPQGTMPRVCLKCGSAFVARLSVVKRGKGLYCSAACSRAKHAQPVTLAPDGLTALISLCNRSGQIVAQAVVDAADAEWAGQWIWSLNNNGYARRRETVDGRQRTILLHRELLGLPRVSDGREGDHKDLDRLNNRRSNLRPVPHIGNQQNMPSNRGSTSAHRGVSWDARRMKWAASVTTGGTKHYLGRFETEEEAAEAARAGRARLLPYAID